jgi:hypothetical protein
MGVVKKGKDTVASLLVFVFLFIFNQQMIPSKVGGHPARDGAWPRRFPVPQTRPFDQRHATRDVGFFHHRLLRPEAWARWSGSPRPCNARRCAYM